MKKIIPVTSLNCSINFMQNNVYINAEPDNHMESSSRTTQTV